MSNEVKIKEGSMVKLTKDMENLLKVLLVDKRLLNESGEYIVKNIKGETRKGGGDLTSLKSLETKTQKRREQIAKNNPTHELYKKNKSNLTLTGQTLDAITFTTSDTKPLISIVAEGDHSGYLQKNGKRTKPVPFKTILKAQAENGRNIFKVSDRMKKTISSIIKSNLRRLLSKLR